MQGRGGRGNFFDSDPFAGFGAFGGFGDHQSLMSSFFGGRDPFDDPFFTQPFGSMFQSSFFGPTGNFPSGAPHAGFIEQQEPQPNKRRGPVIEELDSDDENVEDGGSSKTRYNPRKHSRIQQEPHVEIPVHEADDRRNNNIQRRADFGNGMNRVQSQSPSQFYTFQSSSVSYGGAGGEYYTKSMTRRAGSDGGHTLSRKLNPDGKVDSTQMLHNLNEDELDGFEQAWDGSSGRHFTGSKQRLEGGSFRPGSSSGGGWALPSTQRPQNPDSNRSHTASGSNAAAQMQHTFRKAADRGSHGRTRG